MNELSLGLTSPGAATLLINAHYTDKNINDNYTDKNINVHYTDIARIMDVNVYSSSSSSSSSSS